jgi:hypothetical protein
VRRGTGTEEFRLREQQGLSSPGTEEYSSSDEDEDVGVLDWQPTKGSTRSR